LTRGLNGSEPLDLDPTARERLAARAAARGAGGEVGAAALHRRRAITRSRPQFHVRLGREASSQRGVPIGVLGRDEGSLGRRPAARGGATCRGSSCGRRRARGREEGGRKASSPPRGAPGTVARRRAVAGRRRGGGPSSSGKAAAAAARVSAREAAAWRKRGVGLRRLK
jgi:hypothetical protein